MVAAADSAVGRFASRIAGLVAGARPIPTTILRSASLPKPRRRGAAAPAPQVETVAKASADAALHDVSEIDVARTPVDITMRSQAEPVEEAVAREARKGYDLLVIGVEPL